MRLGLALARIADGDPAGLGAEASKLRAWSAGASSLTLRSEGGATLLARDDGTTHALSAPLAAGLRRLSDYIGLAMSARFQPLTTEELSAATTSPAGVTSVRELFDRALADRVRVGDRWLVQELGGEATIEGGVLHADTFPDPTRALLRAIAATATDPPAVARLLDDQPAAAALLDEAGQLRAETELWVERTKRGVPEDRRRAGWSRAVDAVLSSASDAFVMHPRAQLEAIIAREWSGRLVGLWHLHPPAVTPAGLTPGEPPSPDDAQVARTTGQFLTIVFRPDGFDVYDLSPVARGAAQPAPAAHRSEAWRKHYADLHRRIAGAD